MRAKAVCNDLWVGKWQKKVGYKGKTVLNTVLRSNSTEM